MYCFFLISMRPTRQLGSVAIFEQFSLACRPERLASSFLSFQALPTPVSLRFDDDVLYRMISRAIEQIT